MKAMKMAVFALLTVVACGMGVTGAQAQGSPNQYNWMAGGGG